MKRLILTSLSLLAVVGISFRGKSAMTMNVKAAF